MLDMIEIALRNNRFLFKRIDGQKSLNERTEALDTFNMDPSCTVMLASIGSVAEGYDHNKPTPQHIVHSAHLSMQSTQSRSQRCKPRASYGTPVESHDGRASSRSSAPDRSNTGGCDIPLHSEELYRERTFSFLQYFVSLASRLTVRII